MELSRFWVGVLLTVVTLVWLGGAVALLFILLRAIARDVRDHQTKSRWSTKGAPKKGAATQPASATLIIGPSESIQVGPAHADMIVIGPTRKSALVVAPSQALTVEPPQRAAWDDRGWVKRTESGQDFYEGHYQIVDRRTGQRRRFRGAVVVSGGEVVPYIADPPVELRHHPKHPCFQLSKPPWFKLHWHRAAGNVDDAIIYIERILDEAINGRRAA